MTQLTNDEMAALVEIFDGVHAALNCEPCAAVDRGLNRAESLLKGILSQAMQDGALLPHGASRLLPHNWQSEARIASV